MTTKEALSILLDRVMQNLFEMAADYRMTKPKPGVCKQTWETEKELADVVNALIEKEEGGLLQS